MTESKTQFFSEDPSQRPSVPDSNTRNIGLDIERIAPPSVDDFIEMITHLAEQNRREGNIVSITNPNDYTRQADIDLSPFDLRTFLDTVYQLSPITTEAEIERYKDNETHDVPYPVLIAILKQKLSERRVGQEGYPHEKAIKSLAAYVTRYHGSPPHQHQETLHLAGIQGELENGIEINFEVSEHLLDDINKQQPCFQAVLHQKASKLHVKKIFGEERLWQTQPLPLDSNAAKIMYQGMQAIFTSRIRGFASDPGE